MEQDHYNRGLVVSVPFKTPGPAVMPKGLSLLDKHLTFTNQTSRVLRLNKLSYPIKNDSLGNVSNLLYQLIRARAFVQAVLLNQEGLIGTPFTIIDGTAWVDAVAVPQWTFDLISINILWEGTLPIVSVHMGYRRVIVNHAHYTLTSEHGNLVSMFEYHVSDSPEQAIERLEHALLPNVNPNRYDALYNDALKNCYDEDIEYPIAAASYLNNTVWYVPRPGRHHHVLQSKEYFDAAAATVEKPHQGFITNHGNFINRYRAMLLALLMGQTSSEFTANDDQLRAASKNYHPDDQKLSGIIRQEDKHPYGYLIANTPLFSEDLW